MNSRNKEKERLWKEVMDTRRPWQTVSHEEIRKEEDSLDQLSEDLKRDYGLQEEPEEKSFDSGKAFAEIAKTVSDRVPGQKEAVEAFCTAMRRPYVTGCEKGMARNVILVLGPVGSGRHEMIAETVHELYRRQIVLTGDPVTVDLGRYPDASQEQVFLQDLYEAFQSPSAVVCFENFRTCYPGFLRMLASLVTDGKLLLNKRYVSRNGILVENQTGLVKNATDHLSANDKYLIFTDTGKTADVQDAFGASFLKHIPDVIVLRPLDEIAVKEIITREEKKLEETSRKQLKIILNCDESLNEWVFAHYDKEKGRNGIHDLFRKFQNSLSEVVLKENCQDETVRVTVENDVPVASAHGKIRKLAEDTDRENEIAEVNRELDQIVGLDAVKEYMHSLEADAQIQQRRKQQGLKSSSVSMHMIFTGNPGTGKTTVARLLARYLKAAGILSQGQLVEVTRADLVARYVGQTAPQTMSVIKSALGGILFIDEAYSLYRGKDDSFGLESIDTLVKAMEDYRENLVVILAGYRKEMSVFLAANSGLKSRFPRIIDFPDYTGQELRKIAVLQAESRGYAIADDALDPLEKYFDAVQKEHASEAGNGRLARNVVEAAILHQAQRLLNQPQADLSLLKEEDFDLKK